ncbi:nuclear transport factor 2-like isoform X1 [Phoenix dactylifera]|uniref:Nuclear transport factor 2-like isoform X1 n=1 Tax=Phoenix dactylifera TaxID=42345 RepID=A0A8B7C6V5_PHODC|nr:nuclear transport factor 2-like isoform X1 [Phoenix dactylifera]
MASEQLAPGGSPPSAQVVANAFVHQYYHILHQSPELVYRFYLENSKLGRSEAQGVMSSITTMQAINEKILSMYYREFGAEIKTVDAQESLDGGVLVLVTGYLTGKDNIRRSFTQSFFLATQDKGYYVLNDIFRYVEEADEQQGISGLVNDTGVTLAPQQEAPPPQEQHVIERAVLHPGEEEEVNEEAVYNPLENEDGSVVEEEAPVAEVIDEIPNNSQAVLADSNSATVQEEAPKKSYASIVKVMKDNVTPLSIPASAPARPTPSNSDQQAAPAFTAAAAPENVAASSSAVETKNTAQESEVDGHSIYIKNLPLNCTPEQLHEEFKRFGPIKPGGIQVRSHKQQGFCFGFVEFEVTSAVQSAIEASPIMIGRHQAFVEEKRPAGSRVSNGGRFLSGRGGFRNDGLRGRGNYGGGRGYGRGDYSSRADFSNRGAGRGGSLNRGGGDGGYQRVDRIGSSGGRGNRSVSLPRNAPENVAPRVPAPA